MSTEPAASRLLAGDIGGTKTLLGLFAADAGRPRAVVVRRYGTREFASFADALAAFLADTEVQGGITGAPVGSAAFGVAGPVVGTTARLTLAPWTIDARAIAAQAGVDRVRLINDLEALAWAVPVLRGEELRVLQPGAASPTGNLAVIAAGTGLGEALVHRVDGRFVPSPSESGQADFAARTPRDVDLLHDLAARVGRVSVESVLSGSGLVNIYRVTHRQSACAVFTAWDDPGMSAAVSSAALERRCPRCAEAMAVFVEAYGAEAGNLALRTLATGGLFVGGGIAPQILPALEDGRFLAAFRDKAPFEDLMRDIPVQVILNREAGLLGAAVYASTR